MKVRFKTGNIEVKGQDGKLVLLENQILVCKQADLTSEVVALAEQKDLEMFSAEYKEFVEEQRKEDLFRRVSNGEVVLALSPAKVEFDSPVPGGASPGEEVENLRPSKISKIKAALGIDNAE